MEQHPVPQNVTTFQFRLIGDMTIKQFAYLAGGIVAAIIFYKLPFPWLLTLPLAVASILLGVGLAFVPIEERPMDVWILSFLKSIYSPTLYVWQKDDPNTAKPLASPPPQTTQTPGKPVASPFAFLTALFPKKIPSTHAPSVAPVTTSPPSTPSLFVPEVQHTPTPPTPAHVITQTVAHQPPPQPTSSMFVPYMPPPPSVVGHPLHQPKEEPHYEASVKTPEPKQDVRYEALEQQMAELQKQLEQKQLQDTRIVELQNQLTQVLTERHTMEEELMKLKNQQAQKQQPAPVQAQTAQKSQPGVTVIGDAQKPSMPRLTSTPNIITGILKDGDGNLLPGVLVTVRDKEGIPVRALKTNKLGQFAASTPLPDNTYIIEVEDPRNRFVFDRVQITLAGALVPTLEIRAKSQKDLNRAQLEKEIFGKNV